MRHVSDRLWCDSTVLITIPYARYFSSGQWVLSRREISLKEGLLFGRGFQDHMILFGIVYAMLCASVKIIDVSTRGKPARRELLTGRCAPNDTYNFNFVVIVR
jgi:hypothetical protein